MTLTNREKLDTWYEYLVPTPWEDNDPRYLPMPCWMYACRVSVFLIAWQVLPLVYRLTRTVGPNGLGTPVWPWYELLAVGVLLWLSGAFPGSTRVPAPHTDSRVMEYPRIESWLVAECCECGGWSFSFLQGRRRGVHWLHTDCCNNRDRTRHADDFSQLFESL